jgi:transcription elongation factor
MYPAMGAGTQKLVMGRHGDTDYLSKKRAAEAQAQPNSFMFGVQDVYQAGAGTLAAGSRTEIGNSNVMTTPIMQGADSAAAMAPGQNAGNMSMENPAAQSGSVDLGASSTVFPEQGTMDRIASMIRGGQSDPGLNDRRRVFGEF